MQRNSPLSGNQALFFPAALILFDFAAYLTTNMIQPGIIDIVTSFQADVGMASASVSLYMAGGMALQWLLGPLSDRVGRRPVLLTGSLIFTFSCVVMLFTSSMEQYLVARFVQGTSIGFISTVGYVTVQEVFGQTRAIKLMAIISSIVLIAPIIGPLAGAFLMQWLSWKMLFGLFAMMGLATWLGLLFFMPETISNRTSWRLPVREVMRDFRDVFCERTFLFGSATISCCYIPVMTWVAISPLILIDRGGFNASQFAWTQVPVFGAVILASIAVARFIRDPASPRFIWRTVPLQLAGLLLLIGGDIVAPHLWLWSVVGLSLYAFGAGLIFPTLYRFTLFSNSLSKGTVSASLNMVVLSLSAAAVEAARWMYLNVGKTAFDSLALVGGGAAICFLVALLRQLANKNVADAVA
ncbi:MFS transporter [Pectobacterium sp. A5351]|uniref:MFS transporter n=1 Tax=Pectobacterium sp. A5351 TaxID=2914983 RepID=UPI002FEE59A4